MKINELIIYPVRYDYFFERIVDKDGNWILDIRGGGRFQNDKEINFIGEFMRDIINKKLKELE